MKQPCLHVVVGLFLNQLSVEIPCRARHHILLDFNTGVARQRKT